MENTAVSAKKVLEDGDVTQAAVASEIAGKLYGLKVLEPSINYNKNNKILARKIRIIAQIVITFLLFYDYSASHNMVHH